MQNPLPGLQSFIFGDGKNAPTYESLRKRREIVDLLKQQAVGGEYRNWGDGVGGIMKALGARMMDNKLGPQEDAERSRISEILGGMGGGSPMGPIGGAPSGFTGAGFAGTPEGMPPAPAPGGAPVAPAMGGPGGYRDAIAGIESAGSGDYSAMGPTTKSGDRAYGRYQVMGANIPEWSQAALGQPMTPEQFIANPQAQDAVFDHRFGSYVDQYGPEGAASMWFSGDPTPDGSADQLGTSDSEYVAKFMDGMGGNPGMDMMGMAGMGQPDMGRLSQLADVVGNPYASEGQKIVAQALIEQEMGKGNGGDALGWARLALDREKFASGTREGPKFYGNVQWADRTPDDGVDNPEPYQIGSDGQVSWVELEGAKPLPPVKNVNTGTDYVVQGPGGSQVAPPIAIDNAGKAAETKVGEAAGSAQAGLNDFTLSVQNATGLIDSIENSPDIKAVTGMLQGRVGGLYQGATDTIANIDELVNKTFPLAIEALRGLGAMSEMEGQAAMRSLANLDRKKGTPAFRRELKELRKLLADKLEVAQQKAAMAGGAAQPGSTDVPDGIDPEDWKYMPEELKGMWVR
jgi:hypothetical protein